MGDYMAQPQNISVELMDWKEGLSRVGDDEEFFIELLGDLVELGDETFTGISNLLESNDTGDIERLSHSLKGAAANLGVNGLREPSAKLEADAKENNFENANDLLSEIKSKVDELKKLIDTI